MEKPLDVIVRVRPLTTAESNQKAFVECISSHEVRCGDKTFVFDHVFNEKTSQQLFFYSKINLVVDRCLNSGKSATIMAYGQTSSGKSYTMLGNGNENEAGVIPRAVNRVCACYQGTLAVSNIEVYCDKVRDLFNSKHDLQVLGDGSLAGVTVKRFRNGNLYGKRRVDKNSTANECMERLVSALETANGLRCTAATKMNSRSSRSHSIVCIELEDVPGRPRLGLIDLAGSETAQKSGARGDLLKEGSAINQSLTTLAKVLNSLSDPHQNRHIPYRESKLTQILQKSFEPQCKVCLIINCSPSEMHQRETMNSLRFGERAKKIVYNTPTPTEDDEKRQILREIESLDHELRRWELHGPPPLNEWLNLTKINLTSSACSSISGALNSLPTLGTHITPTSMHEGSTALTPQEQTQFPPLSVDEELVQLLNGTHKLNDEIKALDTEIEHVKQTQKETEKEIEKTHSEAEKTEKQNSQQNLQTLRHFFSQFHALNELYDLKLERMKIVSKRAEERALERRKKRGNSIH